jgi:hypothetical protein
MKVQEMQKVNNVITGVVGVVIGALASTVFFYSQLKHAVDEKDKFAKYFGDCLVSPKPHLELNCLTIGDVTKCRSD